MLDTTNQNSNRWIISTKKISLKRIRTFVLTLKVWCPNQLDDECQYKLDRFRSHDLSPPLKPSVNISIHSASTFP